MNYNRYEELKKKLPSSLRMKLDHIKRYLDEGKAAAMVGAGFSKNARMPEAAEMKDWNALGVDFYRRLYGEPTDYDLRFQNPINLATQVEASFGRHELDDMIQRSLPDDIIVPSRLHVDLLNLGWHDIFTTNYDTLLERACLDADHPYNFVYNKDTLLYSLSPRIIKLHGSFPNIRPYIITEEDYRTYPQRYAEFVNTVRQSLIENLFCLIGFSGDDPNFKAWLGWLRDVMGQRISPVYFITFDKNLHDSRRNLLARQRIEVLNLYDLPNVENIQEAFDFFFHFLKHESNTQWRGSLNTRNHKIDNAEQIKGIILEMTAIREDYPGWLVLPSKYYDDFGDVRSDMLFWGNAPSIDGLKPDEWIAFLHELSWRLEVSMTPIGIDWYVKAIEDLSLEDTDNINQVMDLKLALLRNYREEGQEEAYDELVNLIEAHKGAMRQEQLRRFVYDRCLMASSKMEYDKLRTLLGDWQVFETDFVGALWKGAMLMEADKNNEALNLLNRASTQLRHTILSSQQESYFYKSCQIAIERSLYMFGRMGGTYKRYPECDYVNEMRYFKDKLREASGKRTISNSHGYNVDDVKTTWHFGASGYKETYLYPYRYYMLCEQVGMPAGIPGRAMNENDHILLLNAWMPHNRYYPMGVLVRSCNAKVIGAVLNRRTMASFSRGLANEYFDRFFEYAEQTDKLDNRFVNIHIFDTAIPCAVRMCSKASSDRVKKMALLLMRLHGEFPPMEESKEREYIKTVYESLPANDLTDVLAQVFEQPVLLSGYREDDYYIPLGWSTGISFSSIAVKAAVDGLKNPDEKMQEAAFLRAYQILRGKTSDDDKDLLSEAIRDWRNSTKDKRHVCFSLIDVPPTGDEKISMKDCLNDYIEELLKVETGEIRNSLVYDHLNELYTHINYCHSLLASIDPTPIIQHFSDLVHNNETMLAKDDGGFMGGFKSNMTNVVEGFGEFMGHVDLSVVAEDVIMQVTDAAEILGRLGYPHIALLIRLEKYNRNLKEPLLKQRLQALITTAAGLRQAMDAAHAIEILHGRGRSYQTEVHSIMSLCKYSSDSSVRHWLYALYFLGIKKAYLTTSKGKLYQLLDAIYANNNYADGDADQLNDIRHGASQIAGVLAKMWGDAETTDKWKTLADSDEFNEVSSAFDKGARFLE